MHFVKRTKNESEEQKAALERKRAAKVKLFMEAKERILEKRDKGEFDDELLTLTTELLKKNPDIYTLWEVRREAIQQSRKKNDDEGAEDRHEKKVVKLLDAELKLTQECLFDNPKSYSTWHHRFWALQRHPRPDYRLELELCERALALDCRNFHCWDHRRSIARLASLSAEEEFAFSEKLVGKNPSNYSAWHYRGTLLPKIRPNAEHPEAVLDDECLAQELKKVLDVCAVNSEDQTGWTYCRWLVELAGAKDLGPPQQVVSASFLSISSALFVFSDALNSDAVKSLLSLEEQEPEIQMRALSPHKVPSIGEKWQCAHVWLLSDISCNVQQLQFKLHPDATSIEKNESILQRDRPFVNSDYLKKLYSPAPLCTRNLPSEALNGLVAMCEELIAAEDNPWEVASLTRARLILEGLNEGTAKLAEENCQKLKQFDPQRSAMYQELTDQVRVRTALNSPSPFVDQNEPTTQLEGLLSPEQKRQKLVLKELGVQSLSAIRPLAGLTEDLTLADNRISGEGLSQLAGFAALTHLTLDGNPIESFPPLAFPNLVFLSLARTHISFASRVQPVLDSLPSLERLILAETPLSGNADERKTLQKMVEERNKKLRLILDWL